MILVLLFLLVYDQVFLLPSMQTLLADRFIFLTFTICVQVRVIYEHYAFLYCSFLMFNLFCVFSELEKHFSY